MHQIAELTKQIPLRASFNHQIDSHQRTENKCLSECGSFVCEQNRYILNWWSCCWIRLFFHLSFCSEHLFHLEPQQLLTCLFVCAHISKIQRQSVRTRWKSLRKCDLYPRWAFGSETGRYGCAAVNIRFTALKCTLSQCGVPLTYTCSMLFWFVCLVRGGSMRRCSPPLLV